MSLNPISFGEAGRRGRRSLALASKCAVDSESHIRDQDFCSRTQSCVNFPSMVSTTESFDQADCAFRHILSTWDFPSPDQFQRLAESFDVDILVDPVQLFGS